MPTSTSNVPEAQVAQNLHALERVDVRVQVPDAHAQLLVVLRQVLGHALRQRRHEHALAARGDRAESPPSRSSTWPCDRPHVDGRIDQARRPDDLLDDDAARLLQLVRARASRSRRRPGRRALPTPRSSAAGCRAPTAAGSRTRRALSLRDRSPCIHAAHLRHGLVALVDDDERVLRQVVEQRRRRLARQRGPRGAASSSRCRGSSRSP